MALMPRSKGQAKGPARKTKGFKKQGLLKPKAVAAKRKAKRKDMRIGGGDTAMQAEPTSKPKGKKVGAAAATGGDDDDFQDMALSDHEGLDGPGAEALAAEIEGRDGGAAGVPSATVNQKKKARKKKVQKKASALEFEASRGAAAAIAEAQPSQQADWLWASYSGATGAPAERRGSFDGSFVVPLAGAGILEERLKAAAGPQWRQHLGQDAGRPNGSPSVLLIGSSAAGANDLIKQLPSLHQACKVAKLFAKHFKVPEQQALLTKTAPAIGVGTPHRLSQLAALGALRLDRLSLVLVDVALDAKQRTILDVPETCADFWRFFGEHWGARLAAGQTRIGLFNSQDAP